MAAHDVNRLRQAADSLSDQERRELAFYLLRAGRAGKNSGPDINLFRGTIQLTVDPVEYQNGSR